MQFHILPLEQQALFAEPDSYITFVSLIPEICQNVCTPMPVPRVFEDAVHDRQIKLSENIEDLVNEQAHLTDDQERIAVALEDILGVLQKWRHTWLVKEQ